MEEKHFIVGTNVSEHNCLKIRKFRNHALTHFTIFIIWSKTVSKDTGNVDEAKARRRIMQWV